jgi:hypothetical protein
MHRAMKVQVAAYVYMHLGARGLLERVCSRGAQQTLVRVMNHTLEQHCCVSASHGACGAISKARLCGNVVHPSMT